MKALSQSELQSYRELGYLVQRERFDPGELEQLRAACEQVVERLLALPRQPTLEMGSYVFEVAAAARTVIKWEKDARETVLGIEPLAHLHEDLMRHAYDQRLTGPICDLLGVEKADLYTEKLNLKRAGIGGPIALHQDYPYWVGVADDPARIATAVILLDDSDRACGCLEVAPGSHLEGIARGREAAGFARFEMDPARFDQSRLVPLELAAGSVAYLDPLLVHGSAPNGSSADRRALLYSYQPAGYRHAREYIRIDPERGIEISPSGNGAEL